VERGREEKKKEGERSSKAWSFFPMGGLIERVSKRGSRAFEGFFLLGKPELLKNIVQE
jgi:hypothetical protein